MNGVEIAGPTDSPAVFSLNDTGTFFFSSSLGDQCTAGSLFAVAVTLGNATAGKASCCTLWTGAEAHDLQS